MKRFINFLGEKRKADEISGGYRFHENRPRSKCPHSDMFHPTYAVCKHFTPKPGTKHTCDYAVSVRVGKTSKTTCKR